MSEREELARRIVRVLRNDSSEFETLTAIQARIRELCEGKELGWTECLQVSEQARVEWLLSVLPEPAGVVVEGQYSPGALGSPDWELTTAGEDPVMDAYSINGLLEVAGKPVQPGQRVRFTVEVLPDA